MEAAGNFLPRCPASSHGISDTAVITGVRFVTVQGVESADVL
jgi:hypothetical protein